MFHTVNEESNRQLMSIWLLREKKTTQITPVTFTLWTFAQELSFAVVIIIIMNFQTFPAGSQSSYCILLGEPEHTELFTEVQLFLIFIVSTDNTPRRMAT